MTNDVTYRIGHAELVSASISKLHKTLKRVQGDAS